VELCQRKTPEYLMGRKKKEKNIVGIAIYSMEDWERLRKISDDKGQLEDTWLEWIYSFRRFEDDLRQRGIEYEDILIDLDELIEYCRIQGLRINSESRSRFTANKLRRLHQKK